MHVSIRSLLAVGLLATRLTTPALAQSPADRSGMLRTVVLTDMEQDDLASLIRYLLYTNELDTKGIIYDSSTYHWAGDGNGTKLFLQDREYSSSQWNWRWTGTRTIQDQVLAAWARVYPNLMAHDPLYPTPDELLSKVKIGNIDFEGSMDRDSEGSNHIRSLILDNDSRPLYLQAWGGTATIARALKSIEEDNSDSQHWNQTRQAISRKVVILASGFQDDTYENYIAPSWPQIHVENLSRGYSTWGYNCNKGKGNARGLPDNNEYFRGAWTRANIQTGPYGKLYRSWLDGQMMSGDSKDTWGDRAAAEASQSDFCPPLDPYDFLSEGDNVVFNPLLTTGLQDPANPNLGGWGGRRTQKTASPNLWELVSSEKKSQKNGTESVTGYTTDRWMAPVQNDFAARMQWTLTPDYASANHPPSVGIVNGTSTVKARPGSSVTLASEVSDPDGDRVNVSWWQYSEEGTYPGSVSLGESGNNRVRVTIPADAKAGQTISIILQGTDDGQFPFTRYTRVTIHVT